MNGPKLLALVLGGLIAASPVFADGLADKIARRMVQLGFGDVQVEGTFLGRARITGTRAGVSREIIVNPNTGEILRDLWLGADGQVRAADIDTDDVEDKLDDSGKGRGRSGGDGGGEDGGGGSGSNSGSGGSGSGGSGGGGDDD